MAEKKKGKNAPDKPLVNRPSAFEDNPEFELTDMQSAFVWHYVNDNCTQTEGLEEQALSSQLKQLLDS